MYNLKSPEDLHQALAKGYNEKNIDTLLNLYVENGILVPSPGVTAQGKEEIKKALSQFILLGGQMEVSTTFVFKVGDLAHTRSLWKITDDGKILAQASGTETMKKNVTGDWQFVVDHPFGAS